jgi:hypothetical protein
MKNLLSLLIAGIVFSGCAATMYDEDLDGVKNNKDICLGTPQNTKVDKYGCAGDSDFDGVLDIYDQCKNTVFTAIVDSKGCAIDK